MLLLHSPLQLLVRRNNSASRPTAVYTTPCLPLSLLQGPDCALKTRLLAHCAAALHDGDAEQWEAMLAAGKLDDRLSLAALLCERGAGATRRRTNPLLPAN